MSTRDWDGELKYLDDNNEPDEGSAERKLDKLLTELEDAVAEAARLGRMVTRLEGERDDLRGHLAYFIRCKSWGAATGARLESGVVKRALAANPEPTPTESGREG